MVSGVEGARRLATPGWAKRGGQSGGAGEVAFLLPREAAPKFAPLLRKMESEKETLGVEVGSRTKKKSISQVDV